MHHMQPKHPALPETPCSCRVAHSALTLHVAVQPGHSPRHLSITTHNKHAAKGHHWHPSGLKVRHTNKHAAKGHHWHPSGLKVRHTAAQSHDPASFMSGVTTSGSVGCMQA